MISNQQGCQIKTSEETLLMLTIQLDKHCRRQVMSGADGGGGKSNLNYIRLGWPHVVINRMRNIGIYVKIPNCNIIIYNFKSNFLVCMHLLTIQKLYFRQQYSIQRSFPK